MGIHFPTTPPQDGDDETLAPQTNSRSLLAADSSGNSRRLTVDGSRNLFVNIGATITLPISVASLPLPVGAATEATLDLIKAKTDNLDVLLSTRTKPSDTQQIAGSVIVSNFPVLQPVSIDQTGDNNDIDVISTVLPPNAAQETGGHLASLDGKDFATQTTLGLIKSKTDNLDVALSTRTKPSDTQLVDGSAHTQPISVSSLPLPANAAKETSGNLDSIKADVDHLDVNLSTRNLETTQAAVKADLDEIAVDTDNLALIKSRTDNLDVALSTRLKPGDSINVGNFPATQPVSAVALPLPTGASTEATQLSIKSDLDEISTDTDNLALIKAKTDNLDVLLSTRTKPSDTQLVDGSAHVQPISGFVGSVFLISISLNPGWTIGTVGYYQTGIYGTPLGLLLSLTMTPQYYKVLMTDHGLRRIV